MKYPTKTDVDQRAHDAVFAAARERGLQDIFGEYKTMPRSTANEGGVETYCAEFLEVAVGEVAPDLATFRSVVEEDPSILKGEGKYHLTITPVALQTAKVLDDIETLLTGIMSPLALRAEIKKLSFWSLEQLKARKAQITERQRLSKLPVAEIKQEIAASRPAQSRYFPYDTLPADLTATELKTILRSYKANTYLRQFGAAQLNDRLFGRG